jgi:hypothetical protein
MSSQSGSRHRLPLRTPVVLVELLLLLLDAGIAGTPAPATEERAIGGGGGGGGALAVDAAVDVADAWFCGAHYMTSLHDFVDRCGACFVLTSETFHCI